MSDRGWILSHSPLAPRPLPLAPRPCPRLHCVWRCMCEWNGTVVMKGRESSDNNDKRGRLVRPPSAMHDARCTMHDARCTMPISNLSHTCRMDSRNELTFFRTWMRRGRGRVEPELAPLVRTEGAVGALEAMSMVGVGRRESWLGAWTKGGLPRVPPSP
jgi:hypothetical protein